MESKIIKLDGVNSGFVVYLYDKKDFIRGQKTGKSFDKDAIRFFKNKNLATSYLESIGYVNPYNYKFWIFSSNNIEIDYDDCEYVSGYYESFDKKNNSIYFIKEDNSEKVLSSGYFLFEDDSNIDIHKASNGYYMKIKKVISNLVKSPTEGISINKIILDENGHLTATFKASSAKMHICYNSQIMKLNSERKERENRCIPYDRSVDKHKSIFVYFTNDIDDNIKVNNYIDSLIKYILGSINNESGYVRYIPVEVKGFIVTNNN